MPMLLRNVCFFISSAGAPTRSCHLIRITVVAALHDIVDPDAFVTVIIIVGLPHGPIGIKCNFVIVSEILPQVFKFSKVWSGPEDQALCIVVSGNLISGYIFDDVKFCVLYLKTFSKQKKEEFPVGAKH